MLHRLLSLSLFQLLEEDRLAGSTRYQCYADQFSLYRSLTKSFPSGKYRTNAWNALLRRTVDLPAGIHDRDPDRLCRFQVIDWSRKSWSTDVRSSGRSSQWYENVFGCLLAHHLVSLRDTFTNSKIVKVWILTRVYLHYHSSTIAAFEEEKACHELFFLFSFWCLAPFRLQGYDHLTPQH